MLLIAGLVSVGLLMGCESTADHFERIYKPASTRDGAPAAAAQPGGTLPHLVYSDDTDRDGKLLRQNGYVLIGTSSFNGAPGLSYVDRAVVAQGQKVGAAMVLLRSHSYNSRTSCCSPDPSLEVTSEGGVSYFASYWARSGAAKTSDAQ